METEFRKGTPRWGGGNMEMGKCRERRNGKKSAYLAPHFDILRFASGYTKMRRRFPVQEIRTIFCCRKRPSQTEEKDVLLADFSSWKII